METIEQYNQGSEQFPVIAGMTETGDLELSKREAYLHILCRNHCSQEAGESFWVLPVDRHVDLKDVTVNDLGIVGCGLI